MARCPGFHGLFSKNPTTVLPRFYHGFTTVLSRVIFFAPVTAHGGDANIHGVFRTPREVEEAQLAEHRNRNRPPQVPQLYLCCLPPDSATLYHPQHSPVACTWTCQRGRLGVSLYFKEHMVALNPSHSQAPPEVQLSWVMTMGYDHGL